MKHLNPDQYHKLLKALPAYRATNPFALLIELIARSGMRTHEILAFQPQRDINISQGLLTVHGCKGSNTRKVPVPKFFLKDLHGIDPSTIKPSTLKRRLRHEWTILRQQIFGFGAQGVSMHGLRASFAVAIYKATKDIMLVKDLLGHKSLSSTAYYINLVELDERRSEILTALTGSERAS